MASKGLIDKIKGNYIARNIVLAVSLLIIFLFVTNLLLRVITRHGQHLPVPNFLGLTLDEAGALARKHSLRLEVIDSLYLPGVAPLSVMEQIPKEGANVKKDRRILLTINSMKPKSAVVPNVTGVSLRQARAKLMSAGFDIENIRFVPDIASFSVISEKYDGKDVTVNSKITGELGSGVSLVVGLSGTAAPSPLPKVVGLSVSEAKIKLWDAGFNIGQIHYEDNSVGKAAARVYKQTPEFGKRTAFGTETELFVTVDKEKIEKGVEGAE